MNGGDLVLILICLIFPPAAVGIMTGCSCDLLINIGLTVLGYIPGHIHGFYLIYKKNQAELKYGPGNVTYHGNGDYRPRYGGAAPQAPLGQQSYGTIPS